ncbi:MAG: sigma 54-interacting transcriptional regulator [Spirochaetaceae bacterium]|jgi:DNA-binding NtrC family response regulator|nr:sigma 54-interacting transcriptional regulator [Spirochaetaceae bacterium]
MNNEEYGAGCFFAPENGIMREKIDLAVRFAKSNTPVLVMGEAGAGKRAFVREVLRASRPDIPLTIINCPFFSSPPALDQEDSAVLLVEPAEMDAAGQESLLAWLSVIPPQTVIFSTTRKNWDAESKSGALNNELAAKLGLLPVYLPPLRQRPEDILPLAEYFLDRYSRACAVKISGFNDAACEALRSHRWTGNVRELKNRIEAVCLNKAAASADAMPGAAYDTVSADDLKPGAFMALDSIQIDVHSTLKNALDAFKAAFIKKVLAEFDGNRKKAAASMDIQRTYLFPLLKSYGLE